jgi:hypothetical protein
MHDVVRRLSLDANDDALEDLRILRLTYTQSVYERHDYSSCGHTGSTSTLSCVATTLLAVALDLPQLCCAS